MLVIRVGKRSDFIEVVAYLFTGVHQFKIKQNQLAHLYPQRQTQVKFEIFPMKRKEEKNKNKKGDEEIQVKKYTRYIVDEASVYQ